ncbi:MAG TPA: helix-turn-helix transcriptional regulator [Streptosporangiaceae bacterium]|nr:helix-turn-helix transcriptional regulator [Streptosporangiaceae bacterium]
MPVDYRAPNINARRLGLHLRQLREALELSYDAAAVQVGCDVTWLIRVETGFAAVTPEQVRMLLDRYHVPPHRIRTVLVDLASRVTGPPWLAAHVGRLKALVRDLLTLESEAPAVRTFGIRLMPELVRTEAYARMIFESRIPEGVDPDQEWDLLNSRQRHRPGGRRRTLDVIVDENTLTLPMPPHIMRGQLGRLLALGDDAQATVRVVPMSVGAYPGLHGAFDVLEFPDIKERVSMVHGALGIDIARVDLTDTWKLIEEVALPPDASRAMIAQIVADLPAADRSG